MFFNYPLFFLTLLLPLVIRAYPAVPENGAGTGKTSLSIWPPEDSMQQNRPVKLLRQQNNSPPQNKTSKVKSSGYHCGPVAQYYGQTADDWKAANVNEWLDNWWTDHSSDIQANSNGFAGAFGEWALGNPHWSCQNDGSDSACDFSPCDNPVLNCKEDDIEPTYYVLESLTRLNSYFTGLGEAFEVSSLGAALGKDSWATKFYKDKDQKSVKALRQVINAVMTVVGVAAAGAKAGGDAAGIAGSAVAALFAGAAGAVYPMLEPQPNDTFEKSADMGGYLGKMVVEALKSFTEANNALMYGDVYQESGDIRSYLKDGMFVNFGGINKTAVTNFMSSMLIGHAINQLWRTQKIWVMGGGQCGDGQGIGQGPKDYGVCRDGKAWYLYYWQENDKISLTGNQWGWAAAPPGADMLGKGDYAGVTIANVIDSSLKAHAAAGYNYDFSTASSRAVKALENGENPRDQGAGWEGVFTLPVCDVSGAIGKNYQYGTSILMEYGRGNRPVWCGPVCGENLQKTQDFIQTSNMRNFKSPKRLCKKQPGY